MDSARDAYEDIKRKQGLWGTLKDAIQETVTVLILAILAIPFVAAVSFIIRGIMQLHRKHQQKRAERTLEKERAIQRKLLEDIDQRIDVRRIGELNDRRLTSLELPVSIEAERSSRRDPERDLRERGRQSSPLAPPEATKTKDLEPPTV